MQWAGIDSKEQHIGSSCILVVMQRHNGESKPVLQFLHSRLPGTIPGIPWEAKSFLIRQKNTLK